MLKKIIDTFLNKYYQDTAKEIHFSDLYQSAKGAIINYKRSNSKLWVSSLCYFSILGLVPILAILLSVARWLNIDDYIIQTITLNSPIDQSSLDFLIKLTQNLLDTTRNGVLAGFGFFFLGFSILSLFSIIEKSFNTIWKIKKSKRFSKKVGDFLIICVSLPITVLSMNILDRKIEFFSSLKILNFLIPYIALWLFFMIFYTIIPNTKIHPLHTILSGLFVSILLNQSNFLLVNLQSVIQNHSKIYGSFSIVLIFLTWIKIIWFIILIGAHFTYILQNKDFLKNIDGVKNLNFDSKYKIATLILREFVINYFNNEPPLTIKELSEKTNFSMSITQDIIYLLKNCNMIYEISPEENEYENNYKLSYNCDTMTLNDIKSLLENNGDVYNFCSIDIDFEDLNKRIIDTF